MTEKVKKTEKRNEKIVKEKVGTGMEDQKGSKRKSKRKFCKKQCCGSGSDLLARSGNIVSDPSRIKKSR